MDLSNMFTSGKEEQLCKCLASVKFYQYKFPQMLFLGWEQILLLRNQ